MIVSVVCYNHQFHSAPLAVGMLTNIQQRMLVQETFLQSICCHDSLDSTNNEAKRLIEAGGIQSPALIICRNQTLGAGADAISGYPAKVLSRLHWSCRSTYLD